MRAITTDKLSVESSLVISNILDFEFECRRNEHAMVRITGIIPDTIGIYPIFQKLDKCPLTVSAMEEDGASVIFDGFIHTIQICQEGGCYKAELEGISSTVLLDQRVKCHSFMV